MPLLVIFLIWYFGYGRNNPNIFRNIENKVGKIIIALILFSVFSSVIPALLGLSIALLVLLAMFAPVLLVGFVIFRALFPKQNKKRKSGKSSGREKVYEEVYEEVPTGLVRAVPKRRKLLKKFNKQYDLTLTDEEIERIVDASYFSRGWELEILAMTKEYDSIYQWYNGSSNWLRAYIKVFAVQNISSDFERQRQICLEAFNQIFYEIDPASYGSIDRCIDAINNKYLTYFDEATFMIAYRFLEANGYKYALPSASILRNESDLDKLQRKYDQASDASVEATKARRQI